MPYYDRFGNVNSQNYPDNPLDNRFGLRDSEDAEPEPIQKSLMRCIFCDLLVEEYRYNGHLKSHKPITPKAAVICPICEVKVGSTRIDKHLKKAHKLTDFDFTFSIIPQTITLVQCPICGVDVREGRLNNHLKKPHKRKYYSQKVEEQKPYPVPKRERIRIFVKPNSDELTLIKCPLCQQSLEKRQIQKHINEAHPTYSQTPIQFIARG